MNTGYALPIDNRKRNFVGLRIDNLLHDLLEKESQKREISLSDTIRRLCQERLGDLYQATASVQEETVSGVSIFYREYPWPYDTGPLKY